MLWVEKLMKNLVFNFEFLDIKTGNWIRPDVGTLTRCL